MIGPVALCVLVGALFHWDNALDTSLLQFWWLPLLAAFFFFARCISNTGTHNLKASRVYIVAGFVVAAASIVLLNPFDTILLTGGWLLVSYAIWQYRSQSSPDSSRLTLKISVLISLSLVLLPISVNRVSIVLPSLSGQTHFTLVSEPDDRTIPGAHHYQSLVSYGEQRIRLSANNYFAHQSSPMLLQLSNDQDGVRFVIQDIIYEHAIGLFKLSIRKIRDDALLAVTLHPDSDPVNMTRPSPSGIMLTELAIDDKLWLMLPPLPPDAVSTSQHAGIIGARLLFWMILVWTITALSPVSRRSRAETA